MKFISRILCILIIMVLLVSAPANYIYAIIPGEDAYTQQYANRYHKNMSTGKVTMTTIDYNELVEKVEKLGYSNDVICETYGEQTEMTNSVEEEYNPNAQFGTWEKINPATGSEHVKTVYVGVYIGEEGYARGSGFLIGSNTVVTCGHCVYNKKFTEYSGDKWADRVIVFPARAGDTYPVGSTSAYEIIVPEEWTDDQNKNHDWAILRLNKEFNVGKMGLKTQSASYKGDSIRILGYPGYINEKWNKYMYKTKGTVSSDNTYRIFSKNTSTDGGMSGGPTYISTSSSGNLVIGIHRGHNDTTNDAVRITKDLFNEFATYRD